jgi:hypothetical protein
MGKKNDSKMKAHAAWMKEKGIRRTTGMCPWGCGSRIPNGGGPLIAHLGRCLGSGRRRFR